MVSLGRAIVSLNSAATGLLIHPAVDPLVIRNDFGIRDRHPVDNLGCYRLNLRFALDATLLGAFEDSLLV